MNTKKYLILGLIINGLIFSSCAKGGQSITPSSSNESETSESSASSESISSSEESSESSESSSEEPEITYLSVSEAVELALSVGPEGTAEKQYVTGFVKNITNATYGEMYITDGENDLYIYGVYSANGDLRYNELDEKPYSGDEVFLYGFVKTYNGNPEMGASWLQDFISHQGEIDVDDYSPVDIITARNSDEGSKVLLHGVVANITYANGKVPSGFYLVDNTSSIYVYSNEIAGRVEVGEEIRVAGVRDNYILDSETSYAQQYGYQGSIQVADAIFVESIGRSRDPLKGWIEESTMKNLMETPLTDNITTKIYKVNAIVKKVPGSGFVNYYIDDLDGKTGSYVYTLCNGSDFAYLDAFDNKICTVYVAIHNAKSTNSGIFYRLMPINVKENTDFSMTNADICNFALEYYAAPQFKAEYNSDPKLELLTSVSNEYIPFEDVTLSYSVSSDDTLAHINETDGKVVLNLEKGTYTVHMTVKANYQGTSTTLAFTFEVAIVDIPATITVSDAIDTDDGETVTVRGIVMSSLINQTGFYLNDGTGVIAVRVNATTIKEIDVGNDVVLQGTKTHVKATETNIGQTCIDNATLVANLMGHHDYDKSVFVKSLSFEDIINYKNTTGQTDYTTTVFVVECYLRKNASQYSTNYFLSNADHTKEYSLYAGSGAQYAAFDAFSDGNTLLTVEFALCNWNQKTEYRACIVSASDGETTILNTYNFK